VEKASVSSITDLWLNYLLVNKTSMILAAINNEKVLAKQKIVMPYHDISNPYYNHGYSLAQVLNNSILL